MNITPYLYFQCFLSCLIGNLIHILFKWNSLAKDYKVANMKDLGLWQYIKMDSKAVILNLVGSLALVWVMDEIINSEYVMGKIKLIFILIGISGSYVIMQLFSKGKRLFRQTVDEKTNIADEKTHS